MAALGHRATGSVVAISTLLATIFVAAQAWYARVAFVEASRTRLLEKKLDMCFQNFDQAVALDMALRNAAPGEGIDEVWPPRVVVEDAERLLALKREVVPRLDEFEAGLAKATILGPLDKHRSYLAQKLRGLSKSLSDVSPARIGQAGTDEEVARIMRDLSEFLGGQYSVFTGCRMTALGEE